MTHDHRAELALRALGELPVPEASPSAEARRRRQVVDRLEQLGREGAQAAPRRRWWRLGVAALVLTASAAAATLLVTGVGQQREPAQPAPVEHAMTRGSEVKTEPGSTVQLKSALGAKISVAGSSELRLTGGDAAGGIERVELSLGSIQVKVPKLGAQRQFRVSTPDTLVIVHGTEFSVTVRKDAEGRTNTSVEVTSGRVEVRKQQAVEFLDAGAAWSSRAIPASAALGEAVAAASNDAPSARPKAASAAARHVASAAEPPRGNLAQANALLSAALEASRQGNDTLALTRLDELLRRYPDSPVADSARVERFRTLRRLGRDQDAARAAQKYLKGDPDGFARDEARQLGQ